VKITKEMTRKLAWWAAGLLVTVALAIFSVWLPAPLKKIGLFSCLLGGSLGLVLWKLKEKLVSEQSTGERAFAFLTGGIAEGIRVAESYHLHLAEQRRLLAEEIQKLPALLPLLETELTQRVQQSFTDFLALRYSAISPGLNQSVGPWGLLIFFALEILLSASAAWFVFRYCSTQEASRQVSAQEANKIERD